MPRPQVGAQVEGYNSGKVYSARRVVGPQDARVSGAYPEETAAGRGGSDHERRTDAFRAEAKRVGVFRVGRFEPEEQAPVEDVRQLVNRMIPEWELDDRSRIRVRDVQCPV